MTGAVPDAEPRFSAEGRPCPGARSAEALVALLRCARPTVYRRCQRVHHLGERVLGALGLAVDWQTDAALWLGQSGCVSLPDCLLERVESGATIDAELNLAFEGHPVLAMDWLEAVPEFRGLADAIRLQRCPYAGRQGRLSGADLPLASRLLRLAGDMDWFSAGGLMPRRGLDCLLARSPDYDPSLLAALECLLLGPARRREPLFTTAEAPVPPPRPCEVRHVP